MTLRTVAALMLGSVGAALSQDTTDVRMLLLGDINLGRWVGRIIVAGDTAYPFRGTAERLRSSDLVFANFESLIADANGETEDPRDNLVFCAPPAAAVSLAHAGFDVVSTANNHAFDYGIKGLADTEAFLDSAGVAWTGTSADSTGLFEPAIVNVHGIRVGFVAYTEFVNQRGPWRGRISVFDSARAAKEIRALRRRADVVVASYHGGREYTDRPPAGTRRNLRALAAAGAEIVAGHHPHVPQGVDTVSGRLVLNSLGNFVFWQPQRYWTQIGLAAELTLHRDSSGVSLSSARLIPFAAGRQPSWDLTPGALDSIESRLHSLSSIGLHRDHSTFVLDLPIRR